MSQLKKKKVEATDVVEVVLMVRNLSLVVGVNGSSVGLSLGPGVLLT